MEDIGKIDSNGNLFVTGRVKESGSDLFLSLQNWLSESYSILESYSLYLINLNPSEDIIVLKNAKKINASQIEDLLMQCLETTGEICVKAKSNDNNYDDVHAFIYSR